MDNIIKQAFDQGLRIRVNNWTIGWIKKYRKGLITDMSTVINDPYCYGNFNQNPTNWIIHPEDVHLLSKNIVKWII